MTIELQTLVELYVRWIRTETSNGLVPYYINIMFNPLRESSQAIIAQMRYGITNFFYPTLCKRVAHHPHRKSQQRLLPKAMLFADLPIHKRIHKVSLSPTFNRGLHYNGVILLSPKCRLGMNFVEHIERKSTSTSITLTTTVLYTTTAEFNASSSSPSPTILIGL
jgi:hypothetical protein